MKPPKMDKRGKLYTPETCPHLDWTILDSHRFHYGICTMCYSEVLLPTLLRNWKKRIEAELGL